MSFVSLQSPIIGERLRRSIGTMLFLCRRSPAGVSLFRNFTGSLVESLGSLALLAIEGMLLPNAIVLAN